MSEPVDTRMAQAEERSQRLLEAILAVAQPRAVWGEPIHSGDRVIITASEVAAGGGFGMGFGTSAGARQSSETEPQSAGGGGGGGGGGSGRPVAVVMIGPDGVRVRPVVDVTKIALAALTTWGAMLAILIRLRRSPRR